MTRCGPSTDARRRSLTTLAIIGHGPRRLRRHRPATTAPSRRHRVPRPAPSRRPAAEHEPVTIVVGAAARRDPGGGRRARRAGHQFEAKTRRSRSSPRSTTGRRRRSRRPSPAARCPTSSRSRSRTARRSSSNGQIADIDALVRALRLRGQVQPERPRNGQDADGQDLRRPAAGLRHGLQYNRQLFKQAGLDPDKPPDDVGRGPGGRQGHRGRDRPGRLRADGDREHRRLAADRATYARGGRMQEVAEDGNVTSTVNNAGTKAALEFLKALRWEDNSMGSNFATPGARSTRRSRPARSACTPRARTSTPGWSRTPDQPGRLRPDRPSRSTDAGRGRARRRRHRRRQRRHDRGEREPRSRGSTSTTCRSCWTRKRPSPTPRPSRERPARRRPRRCRSSTRPPTTSPRTGSRTTSTSRSTR